MNERNKDKLKEKFKKIQTGLFNTDDVELLLINIRDFARTHDYLLLLEFCDFVAHSDRNKGLLNDEIDIFYSQYKYKPIKNTTNLDYDKIPKIVQTLIFQKAIDQLNDNFLISNFGKNANQLKNYITSQLLTKNGNFYSVLNENAKTELEDIQNLICKTPVQIKSITAGKFLMEFKTCVKDLSRILNVKFDSDKFDKIGASILLRIFEIIQNCHFQLHDGEKAYGFITVGGLNELYQKTKRIEHLNISFTVKIPVQQSFAIIEILPTGLTLGNYLPETNNLVEWLNSEMPFGIINKFRINEFHKILPNI